MKKTAITLILILSICLGMATTVLAKGENEAEDTAAFALSAKSACLMDARTGEVLYSHAEHEKASPASVTKIMTLLLVCEALEHGSFTLEDTVSISEYAASMGGSQVFLEEGERFSVEELIKCTVIASANDAAVALAELVAGTEGAFVNKMNERAGELGLTDTAFENVTGLDDTAEKHYSSAIDIALMSRELIKHDIITKYSSVWQDTIRNGEFTLTNTNRLVRYYDGCNGLKTGSTDKAGYCVSATAKRGEMQLIAVIMGAPSRDARNQDARTLLDYGFASYALFCENVGFLENVPVLSGRRDFVAAQTSEFAKIVERAKLTSIERIYEIPEKLTAPVKKGDKIGRIIYKLDGEEIGSSDILASDSVEKIGLFEIFCRIMERILCFYD